MSKAKYKLSVYNDGTYDIIVYGVIKRKQLEGLLSKMEKDYKKRGGERGKVKAKMDDKGKITDPRALNTVAVLQKSKLGDLIKKVENQRKLKFTTLRPVEIEYRQKKKLSLIIVSYTGTYEREKVIKNA